MAKSNLKPKKYYIAFIMGDKNYEGKSRKIKIKFD